MRIEKSTGYERKVTGVKVVSDREAEKRATKTFEKEQEAFRRYVERATKS